jgi:hypothetical protein
MDGSAFDRLTQSLITAGSRRRALGSLFASTLGLLGSWREEAAAKNCKKIKNKRKRKKCLAKAKTTATCPVGQKPCDGSCIPSNQCCDNGDCQVSGQVCIARQCTCPSIFPDVCGGACVAACNRIRELRVPDSPTCRCCITNGWSTEGDPNNCCSSTHISGTCAGRPAGDSCSWEEHCRTQNCVEGKCSSCTVGFVGDDYCNNLANTCSNSAGRCLSAIDGTIRCGIPEVGNEGDCGWCTRNFDCDQGVRPGAFCAVATGPNCGCPQGQTFCALPA